MQYQIGPWLFSPARCLISTASIEKELEPLSFKLLSYLIENSERIVSRQELVEHVWRQSFVDDNAINRAMSELRKQLSHPEHKAPIIKTHYRKGYGLTVPVSSLNNISDSQLTRAKAKSIAAVSTEESALPTQQENIDTAKLTKPWLFIAITMLLIAVIAFQFFQAQQGGQNTSVATPSEKNTNKARAKKSAEQSQALATSPVEVPAKVTSATWNIGAEYRPLVSPDSQLFAFYNKSDGKTTSYIKNLLTQKQVQLNYKDLHITVMSWQPQSRLLLAEATNYDSECYFAVFDIADIDNIPAPSLIKTCEKEAKGFAQLSINGAHLYYIALDKNNLGGEILQFNINTKQSRLLVPSKNIQFGVRNLALSPDGKYLLYKWLERGKPTQIFALNLTSREQVKVFQSVKENHSTPYTWLPNSNTIAILQGQTIKTFNIKGEPIDSYKIPNRTWKNDISFIDDKQLLTATLGGIKYQMTQIDGINDANNVSNTIMQPSGGSDYFTETAQHDKEISYFISTRSGSQQIWQANGDQVKQLSQFSNTDEVALYLLKLSPDDRFILFTRDEKLEFIDTTTGDLHQIDELKDTIATSYLWANGSKEVLYSTIEDNISQIWRFDLLTRSKKQLTSYGGEKLLKNNQGDIFYINDNHLLSLINYNKHTEYKQKINLPIAQCWCSLDLTEQYFYSSPSSFFLHRMKISSGEASQILLPFKHNGVHMIDDNSFITSKPVQIDTSIQRFSWHDEQTVK